MIWLWVSIAWSNPHPTLTEILQHLPQHPEWKLTHTANQQAKSERLMATAPFTPTLQGKSSQYGGYYPRDNHQHQIHLNTPLGISVGGGWQQGLGDFPDYDGSYTTDRGEFRLETTIPLLDGLWINQARTDLWLADLNVDLVALEQQSTQIKLILQTELAFWNWQQYWALEQVAKQNLALANQRQTVFEKKYAVGSTSRLSVIDNARERQQRQQLWLQSQQQTIAGQNKLLYFWRTEDGQMQASPTVPTLDIQTLSIPQPPPAQWEISNRPDIALYGLIMEQIRLQLQLVQAKKLPKVNLIASYDHAIESTKQSESYVGLKYEHAPLLRAEKSKQSALEAKNEAIQLYQRKTIDKANQDLRTLHNRWVQLVNQIETQQEVVKLAKEAVTLEQIRFDNGGSDLLDLIKRENNWLKAQSTLIKLIIEVYVVEAMWRATLGISSIP